MRTPQTIAAMSGGTDTAADTAHDADHTKMADFVTALATFGPTLTKTFKADGTTESYGEGQSFTTKQIAVADLPALSRLLTKLQDKPQHCVIRGDYVGDDKAEKGKVDGSIARTNTNFNDCPHHWFMVDIDKYEPGFADPVREPVEAIKDYLAEQLPPCFQDVSFHWQLSSSAGAPGKAHILKAHVWFWSETPYTSAQMYEWAKQVGPRVDKAVYRRVQIHYTSNPIFEAGVPDPVPVRSGFYQGARDMVPLMIDQGLLDSARTTGTGSGGSDMKLVDPSEKMNEIGAYHAAFEAHTVLMEHLEGMFAPGQNDRRWTWLDGGGTPEGVWVHNDGMHVGATHNTWPAELEGAPNLWDLVRVFKFGHLDHSEDDFAQFNIDEKPIQDKPSHKAMLEWVYTLPEFVEKMAEIENKKAEREARERQSALDAWRAKIRSAADEFTLREGICPGIAKDATLSGSQLDALAVEVNNKLGSLTGAKPGPAAAKRLIRPERNKTPGEGKPAWLKNWCYVTDQDKFYRYDSDEWLTMQGFNAKHSRNIPPPAEGERIQATFYALELSPIEVVTRGAYLPGAAPIFRTSGTKCVNTYRPSTVPKESSKLDSDGKQAVELVRKHLTHICGGRKWVVEVLLDWFAHNIQNPGKKIRFSPVIQGIEGDGKSALGTLLAVTMGEPNVHVISPEVISKGDFNSWAQGACIGVLEELRLQGNNRYDVLNSVKPCVSNDTIQIHRKRLDPYNVPNTMNYIAFTNHKDALPLSDTDRRWLVIFTPWGSIEEFVKIAGSAVEEYFAKLHDAIYTQAPQLRRYLLDRDLSSFNPNGRAPETEEKKIMVSLGASDELTTVRELIETGGLGYGRAVVSTRMLSRAIEAAGVDAPKTVAMNKLMVGLGFHKFPTQVKWSGEGHRVWTAQLVTRLEDVRRLLDVTAEDVVEGDFED